MRVAGTPEARRAWFALRGSYMLAYLGVLSYPFLERPDFTSVAWTIWSILIAIIGMALVLGSAASLAAVNNAKKLHRWILISVLEVTGLRAFVFLEYGYAAWTALLTDDPIASAVIHFIVASFALGVLANMVWHKGVTKAGGVTSDG